MESIHKFLQRHISVLIVLVVGIIACRALLFESGYFNMHDDLQMMRQLQMEKCFAEGQIPCRWVSDMGYGYGFPLFNFYPPLPYLIGQIFRLVGFSFVDTVKYAFSASIILSGIFMFYLAREFLNSDVRVKKYVISVPAIVASAFYIWAPYHAVDVYVRGAMNEAWALTWFPLIFFSGYKLIISKNDTAKRWIAALAFSYFALFTSHNLMVLIFTPVFCIWVLIFLWREKAWGKIPVLIISGMLALFMAAFFTFPALAENKYTQIESQLIGYYEYNAHFVSINQLLFSRFWGYGPSVWLEEDRMSFQIGHLHWILSLIAGVYILLRTIIVAKKDGLVKALQDRVALSVLFLFAVGWASAFMTHLKSIDIWLTFDRLKYLQFPWRFLTLVIFSLSFVVGSIFIYIKGKLGLVLGTVLLIAVILFNWTYFLPEYGKLGKLTDEEKFTGAAWDLQQTAGIYDYLPLKAKRAPNSPKKETFEFVSGSGSISKVDDGTYWSRGNILVLEDNSEVRVNIFDFPGWKIFVNGNEVSHYISDTEQWGRMYISLDSGEHFVYVQFHNTPIRTISNIVSLLAWAIFVYILAGKKLFSLR